MKYITKMKYITLISAFIISLLFSGCFQPEIPLGKSIHYVLKTNIKSSNNDNVKKCQFNAFKKAVSDSLTDDKNGLQISRISNTLNIENSNYSNDYRIYYNKSLSVSIVLINNNKNVGFVINGYNGYCHSGNSKQGAYGFLQCDDKIYKEHGDELANTLNDWFNDLKDNLVQNYYKEVKECSN